MAAAATARRRAAAKSAAPPQDDEDSDSSSAPSEESMNVHSRPARTTAGRNESVRDKKAQEDHETFWGHMEAFDDSDDGSEVAFASELLDEDDSSDSDIDTEEGEAPAEALEPVTREELAEDEEAARRKRARFVMPGSRLLSRGVGRGRGRGRGRGPGWAGAALVPKPKRILPPPDRCLRASTAQRSALVQAKVAAEAATGAEGSGAPTRRARRAGPGQVGLTQEQRLREAVLTEELNLVSLRSMQNTEDALRQTAKKTRQRKRYDGPRIRFVSKLVGEDAAGELANLIGGRPGVVNFVEFIACDPMEVLANGLQKKPPAAKKARRGDGGEVLSFLTSAAAS